MNYDGRKSQKLFLRWIINEEEGSKEKEKEK